MNPYDPSTNPHFRIPPRTIRETVERNRILQENGLALVDNRRANVHSEQQQLRLVRTVVPAPHNKLFRLQLPPRSLGEKIVVALDLDFTAQFKGRDAIISCTASEKLKSIFENHFPAARGLRDTDRSWEHWDQVWVLSEYPYDVQFSLSDLEETFLFYLEHNCKTPKDAVIKTRFHILWLKASYSEGHQDDALEEERKALQRLAEKDPSLLYHRDYDNYATEAEKTFKEIVGDYIVYQLAELTLTVAQSRKFVAAHHGHGHLEEWEKAQHRYLVDAAKRNLEYYKTQIRPRFAKLQKEDKAYLHPVFQLEERQWPVYSNKCLERVSTREIGSDSSRRGGGSSKSEGGSSKGAGKRRKD